MRGVIGWRAFGVNAIYAAAQLEYRTVRRHVSGSCRDGSSKVHCGAVEERTVEVIIDEWVYDFGSNRFVQHVLFEHGTLVRVISGSYGHKDPS
jgi:hypothetical protein